MVYLFASDFSEKALSDVMNIQCQNIWLPNRNSKHGGDLMTWYMIYLQICLNCQVKILLILPFWCWFCLAFNMFLKKKYLCLCIPEGKIYKHKQIFSVHLYPWMFVKIVCFQFKVTDLGLFENILIVDVPCSLHSKVFTLHFVNLI